ncbi:flagellar motor switch phosphatase FliY [Sporosarcina sp. FSL W8-0480]|uniref:flagellar motor switch phosphatase FliY n=1 Tax=Sporosarcina sp. FSL W8-0480 TaxID=2954701 RepID=UPI0030DD0A79
MMSDNILSQEEIEALLRGEDIQQTKTDTSSQTNQYPISELSEMEKDALGEVGNISFGSSATALSSLLSNKVEITTPSITVVDRTMLMAEFTHPYIVVQVKYTEGLNGMNLLIIKQRDAAVIADLMLGEDGQQPPEELNEIRLSAVQEAMNQMMGSAATSMSTVFNKRVDISPPTIDVIDMKRDDEISYIPENEPMIKVSFKLKVGNLIDSHIMQLFPLQFGKDLVTTLMGMDVANESAVTMETPILPPTRNQQQSATIGGRESHSFGNSEGDSQESSPSFDEGQQNEQVKEQQPTVQVQQAQFASFETQSFDKAKSNNLNMLLDIPLQVTVELGRTKRSVKEILEMSSGYIIELDKLAGEPVDILVNNRHIARGEVVVIDENFGVRITDVLSQKERLNNLR